MIEMNFEPRHQFCSSLSALNYLSYIKLTQNQTRFQIPSYLIMSLKGLMCLFQVLTLSHSACLHTSGIKQSLNIFTSLTNCCWICAIIVFCSLIWRQHEVRVFQKLWEASDLYISQWVINICFSCSACLTFDPPTPPPHYSTYNTFMPRQITLLTQYFHTATLSRSPHKLT